jgi:hypothetical protein
MKPAALGHVTCGLGGAGGLRLAMVGAGCVFCLCVWLVVVGGCCAAGDLGCLGLVVEVVVAFFWLVGGLLEW